MLGVKMFRMESFLPASYEEDLTPELEQVQQKPQNGTGTGSEFTGWVKLPQNCDKEEFVRIKAAAMILLSAS